MPIIFEFLQKDVIQEGYESKRKKLDKNREREREGTTRVCLCECVSARERAGVGSGYEVKDLVSLSQIRLMGKHCFKTKEKNLTEKWIKNVLSFLLQYTVQRTAIQPDPSFTFLQTLPQEPPDRERPFSPPSPYHIMIISAHSSLVVCRASWSCGLIFHVLDRGSNLAVAGSYRFNFSRRR